MTSTAPNPHRGATFARRIRTLPAWFWALGIAALASVPALRVGFVGDDLVQRLSLEQPARGVPTGVWSLYGFVPAGSAPAQIESGALPWFSDPALTLNFFRPLTSGTLALDQTLFGRNAFLAHAHSVLWLLLLTFLCARLYQRWFTARMSVLSAVVFALAGLHGVPSAWLASRHTLVAGALGVAALAAWVRHREDLWRPGRWLAPLLLLASLFASESALVAVVFLTAYELAHRCERGLRGAFGYTAFGLGYLVLYAAFGYGVRGSGGYLSPFLEPSRYLAAGSLRVPALLADLLCALPADAASAPGPWQIYAAVIGVVAALLYGSALYAGRAHLPESSRRVLLWLAPATCVGLWALAGAMATSRVLPLALFGAAAVVAHALGLLGDAMKRGNWPLRLLYGVPLVVASVAAFGLSPWVRLQGARQLERISKAHLALAERADLGPCDPAGDQYLLTASDPNLALYAGPALAFYTPEKARARRFRVLSLAPHSQRLSRVAPNAFELETLGRHRRRNLFEDLLRSPDHPVNAGEHFALSELSVDVQASENGAWTRARFEFQRDLGDGHVCLIIWRGGRLEAIPVPALGTSLSLPYEPGPMGM
jgi:hypothetical protein